MEDKTNTAGSDASSKIQVELECVTGIRLRKGEETFSFPAGSKIKVSKPFSAQVQEYVDQKVLIPFVEKKSQADILKETQPEAKFICTRRIRYNGEVYATGRAFPNNAPEEIINELLSSKAIERI